MKYLFTILFIVSLNNLFAQSVGIGTNTPHGSAALDITNTSKGILIPRMTLVQRLAIQGPSVGLTVFQTDSSKGFWYFNGAGWTPLMELPTGGTQGQVITFCEGVPIWTSSGTCPAKLSALNCNNAINNGTLTAFNLASSVNSVIPYTGSNGGTYDAFSVGSTGVTGLTASLSAGTLASGSGNLTFTISGTPSSSGTANFAISIGGQTCSFSRTVNALPGSISTINCGSAVNNGIITEGEIATGVTSVIPYTGGNGGFYTAQSVSSSGVKGLVASLTAGSFANGSGNLTYLITGIPDSRGTASFTLNIGGKTCILTREISGTTQHLCAVSNVHNPNKSYGIMSDIEGNEYRTITIGTQIWMAENLKTTSYSNGDTIANISDETEWSLDNRGAFCNYDLNAANDCPYGKLYNWYAVTNERNICPSGWHVPTINDWNLLFEQVGEGPGNILKNSGNTYWSEPNTSATNESGFSALPGGYRTDGGLFELLHFFGYWWSSDNNTKSIFLDYESGNATITNTLPEYGLSVRCISDESTPVDPSISSLGCEEALNFGAPIAGTTISDVSSRVPYTGGNGGSFGLQSISSTGVTGLTATLFPGTLANGNGNLNFVITGIPSGSGNANFTITIGGITCVLKRTIYPPAASISSLNCNGATNIGTIFTGTTASGVSSSIPYTGGNGGTIAGQSVASSGVTGLTATLNYSTLAVGNGNLTYTITGTPSTSGTASFALSVGGQTCILNRIVSLPLGTITSLNCAGAVIQGTLRQGVAASNVSITIQYTGGNGGSYPADTITSALGGLKAILAAGNFANGAGTLTYSVSGIPDVRQSQQPIDNFLFYRWGQECYILLNIAPPSADITMLNCASSTNTGLLFAGSAASSVSSTISYMGGNGGSFAAQTIASTGVTGLTATLSAGTVAGQYYLTSPPQNGNGSFTFSITGTPSSQGAASFSFSIGGQNCTINRTVYPVGMASGITSHSCGATNVHNASLPYGSMTDQEGNTYRTIQLGNQLWMAENLKTTKFRNGVGIANVTDSAQWADANVSAYCYYNNNASSNCPYGILYNWFAVSSTNNLCPTGWHVPTESDWADLVSILGSDNAMVGNKMRSTGSQYWLSGVATATNSSGFSALPAGYRTGLGVFLNNRYESSWWTVNSFDSDKAWSYLVTGPFSLFFTEGLLIKTTDKKTTGSSVRCVKD